MDFVSLLKQSSLTLLPSVTAKFVSGRDCPERRKLHNYFCPTCGTTICWTFDLRPNLFGVAVGCFNDRNFPRPILSTWEEEMYAWVVQPANIQHFPRGRMASSMS